MTSKDLDALADNFELMEIGRKAIEDVLVEWRDARRSSVRNNGFTIKERDGSESCIIRFGPEVGVRVALKAIAARMKKEKDNGTTTHTQEK